MYEDMLKEINERTNFESIKLMLDYILEQKLITRREAEIIAQISWRLYNSEKEKNIAPEERAKLIRSIFATLSKIT